MPPGRTLRKEGTTLNDSIQAFCPACGQHADARIVERCAVMRFRGEDVAYSALSAVCPNCGVRIADPQLEGTNLERACDRYRAAHGLVSARDIARLRARTRLSLRELSRYLGFGEQTIARYERGDMPDLLHSNTVKMATTPEGARLLLRFNGDRISERSRKKVELYIEELDAADKEKKPPVKERKPNA